MYHREPLSLLSSLVAQDSPQSRRILFIYIHITAVSLFLSGILPACPSHPHPCICSRRRSTCSFFRCIEEAAPRLRSRRETSLGNLKEAGRFKAVAVFPTAASAKDLNNIVLSPSSSIFTCSSSFFRIQATATRSSSTFSRQTSLATFTTLRVPTPVSRTACVKGRPISSFSSRNG